MELPTQNSQHTDEVALATAVAEGSVEAWHDFVGRYSRLIVLVIRRHLQGYSEDDQRDAYIDTLEHFYATGLAQYDGSAALSTWVITAARSRCMDLVRKKFGRHREPLWLQSMPERHRNVYRLYFVESRGYDEIQAWFRGHGVPVTRAEIVELVEILDREIDPRERTRLAYELHARSVGAVSGRLLELLDGLRLEAENRAEKLRPDYQLFEAQSREMLACIRSYVDRLPEPDRKVVELHFFQDLTAKRVALEMNLPNARRAYTLLGRALRRLRLMIASEGISGYDRKGSTKTEDSLSVESNKDSSEAANP